LHGIKVLIAVLPSPGQTNCRWRKTQVIVFVSHEPVSTFTDLIEIGIVRILYCKSVLFQNDEQ
jgi:hypothetical protein